MDFGINMWCDKDLFVNSVKVFTSIVKVKPVPCLKKKKPDAYTKSRSKKGEI